MATGLCVQSDAKFSSFIHNNFSSLLNDSSLSDVEFEIVDNSSSIHEEERQIYNYYGCRSLFAIHSAVFRNMLYGSMMEADCRNVVRLNDISCDTFEFLQQCFYGLNPSLSTANVVPVLCASDKYLIKPLKNLCIHFILNLATNTALHSNRNDHDTECHTLKIKQIAIENENESAISMFLSSLNLLFQSQQIDVIHQIISSISNANSTSNSAKIWNSIVTDKNWYSLHHSLITLILSHLIRLNESMKAQNQAVIVPASRLWMQCKKWCQFQTNLLNQPALSIANYHCTQRENEDKEKTKKKPEPQKRCERKTEEDSNEDDDDDVDDSASNITQGAIDYYLNDEQAQEDNVAVNDDDHHQEEEKDDEKLQLQTTDEHSNKSESKPKTATLVPMTSASSVKWYDLMKRYFKRENVIMSILYELNPYFFMKNKSEISKILSIVELNKIYEHFLYKRTKIKHGSGGAVGHGGGNGLDADINQLSLCSDNVLYLYDDFRRITRSKYGDTEFIRCASDIGWNTGIHQFSVKCYITGNQASIGIVTNPKAFIDPQSAFPFDINEVGISYYWYGSNVYGYRYGQQQFNNNIGYEWQNGDIISIIINCQKWTIQFLKNYEKIGKIIKILPDQYYYVALCDGIYSEEIYYEGLIDYKVLVCQ